jgi:hypothetical protein
MKLSTKLQSIRVRPTLRLKELLLISSFEPAFALCRLVYFLVSNAKQISEKCCCLIVSKLYFWHLGKMVAFQSASESQPDKIQSCKIELAHDYKAQS